MNTNFQLRHALSVLFIAIFVSLFFLGSSSEIKDSDSPRYQTIYESDGNQNWEVENKTEISRYAKKTGDPNVMVEVTDYPNTDPTSKQLENAWKLYDETYENAVDRSWFEKQEGLSSGYFNWDGDAFHYPHENYNRQNKTLNPEKPEFLMYYTDPDNQDESILAGVMFQTSNVKKHGDQIGGPITNWHYHYFDPEVCLAYWGAVSNVEIRGPNGEKCPENTVISNKSYEMLHVWFVDHPDSQFSSDMVVPKEVLEKGTDKLDRAEFFSKHG